MRAPRGAAGSNTRRREDTASTGPHGKLACARLITRDASTTSEQRGNSLSSRWGGGPAPGPRQVKNRGRSDGHPPPRALHCVMTTRPPPMPAREVETIHGDGFRGPGWRCSRLRRLPGADRLDTFRRTGHDLLSVIGFAGTRSGTLVLGATASARPFRSPTGLDATGSRSWPTTDGRIKQDPPGIVLYACPAVVSGGTWPRWSRRHSALVFPSPRDRLYVDRAPLSGDNAPRPDGARGRPPHRATACFLTGILEEREAEVTAPSRDRAHHRAGR